MELICSGQKPKSSTWWFQRTKARCSSLGAKGADLPSCTLSWCRLRHGWDKRSTFITMHRFFNVAKSSISLAYFSQSINCLSRRQMWRNFFATIPWWLVLFILADPIVLVFRKKTSNVIAITFAKKCNHRDFLPNRKNGEKNHWSKIGVKKSKNFSHGN